MYPNVKTIYVYPSAVLTPERKLGVFEVTRVPLPRRHPIVGEAIMHGPVILVWDTVLKNAKHPEKGHNVVFHEFAHVLDMLDGSANGTPPLHERSQYEKWANTCEREFVELKKAIKSGKHSFLDPYGATNEAEFFAVITELFFDKPKLMLEHFPDLYAILKEFYKQDPAERERIAANHGIIILK